jgi:low temperature requirement protein LtrA
MLVAVFGVWSYTSFEATLIRVTPSQPPLILLGVMLVGLFMNAAIGRAFGSAAWAFVVPFPVIQLGRPLWTIATAPTRMLREHYVVMLAWIVATAPLWVIGAAADPATRLAWWALAAAADLVGTWFAHPVPGRVLDSEHVQFDADHMIERCRLLLIIALGEVVLTTGVAIAGSPVRPANVLTGSCALVSTVALWALYFAGSDHLVNRHVETTSKPILAGRLTMNGLGVAVAGLVALAVGSELVIEHPGGGTGPSLALLLFGGPLVYVAAQSLYLRMVTEHWSAPRLVGSAALALAGVASLDLRPAASAVVLSVSLLVIVGAVLRVNAGHLERSELPDSTGA